MVMGELPREADLVVLGGGPGGYSAAFRAADLGLDTVLVEARSALGGECLHVGCIPSKALLGIAALVHDAAEAAEAGVTFGPARVDAPKLRAWTQRSIDRLAQGLAGLAKARGIDVLAGHGRFERDGSVRVAREDAPPATLHFKHAIVATGSRPAALPGLDIGPRVWDSTAALSLPSTPARLLVVGGGYIGLELGSVYAALGAEVTVVELLDGLLPGVDRDLVALFDYRNGVRWWHYDPSKWLIWDVGPLAADQHGAIGVSIHHRPRRRPANRGARTLPYGRRPVARGGENYWQVGDAE